MRNPFIEIALLVGAVSASNDDLFAEHTNQILHYDSPVAQQMMVDQRELTRLKHAYKQPFEEPRFVPTTKYVQHSLPSRAAIPASTRRYVSPMSLLEEPTEDAQTDSITSNPTTPPMDVEEQNVAASEIAPPSDQQNPATPQQTDLVQAIVEKVESSAEAVIEAEKEGLKLEAAVPRTPDVMTEKAAPHDKSHFKHLKAQGNKRKSKKVTYTDQPAKVTGKTVPKPALSPKTTTTTQAQPAIVSQPQEDQGSQVAEQSYAQIIAEIEKVNKERYAQAYQFPTYSPYPPAIPKYGYNTQAKEIQPQTQPSPTLSQTQTQIQTQQSQPVTTSTSSQSDPKEEKAAGAAGKSRVQPQHPEKLDSVDHKTQQQSSSSERIPKALEALFFKEYQGDQNLNFDSPAMQPQTAWVYAGPQGNIHYPFEHFGQEPVFSSYGLDMQGAPSVNRPYQSAPQFQMEMPFVQRVQPYTQTMSVNPTGVPQVTPTVGNPQQPQAAPFVSGFTQMYQQQQPSAHPQGMQMMVGQPNPEFAYGQVPYYGKKFKKGMLMNPEKDPRFGKVGKKGFKIDQKQLQRALAPHPPTYFSQNNLLPAVNLSHKQVVEPQTAVATPSLLPQTATLNWDFDGHSKLESKLEKKIEKRVAKEGYATFSDLDAAMLDEHPEGTSVFIDPAQLTFKWNNEASTPASQAENGIPSSIPSNEGENNTYAAEQLYRFSSDPTATHPGRHYLSDTVPHAIRHHDHYDPSHHTLHRDDQPARRHVSRFDPHFKIAEQPLHQAALHEVIDYEEVVPHHIAEADQEAQLIRQEQFERHLEEVQEEQIEESHHHKSRFHPLETVVAPPTHLIHHDSPAMHYKSRYHPEEREAQMFTHRHETELVEDPNLPFYESVPEHHPRFEKDFYVAERLAQHSQEPVHHESEYHFLDEGRHYAEPLHDHLRHLGEAERDRQIQHERFHESQEMPSHHYRSLDEQALHQGVHHEVSSDKPYDFDLRPKPDPDVDAEATLQFKMLPSKFHPRSALQESYYYFNKEQSHGAIPLHMRDEGALLGEQQYYHHEQYDDSINDQEADMIHHVRDFPESDKGQIIDRFADMGPTDYGFSHLKDAEKWRSEHQHGKVEAYGHAHGSEHFRETHHSSHKEAPIKEKSARKSPKISIPSHEAPYHHAHHHFEETESKPAPKKTISSPISQPKEEDKPKAKPQVPKTIDEPKKTPEKLEPKQETKEVSRERKGRSKDRKASKGKRRGSKDRRQRSKGKKSGSKDRRQRSKGKKSGSKDRKEGSKLRKPERHPPKDRKAYREERQEDKKEFRADRKDDRKALREEIQSDRKELRKDIASDKKALREGDISKREFKQARREDKKATAKDIQSDKQDFRAERRSDKKDFKTERKSEKAALDTEIKSDWTKMKDWRKSKKESKQDSIEEVEPHHDQPFIPFYPKKGDIYADVKNGYDIFYDPDYTSPFDLQQHDELLKNNDLGWAYDQHSNGIVNETPLPDRHHLEDPVFLQPEYDTDQLLLHEEHLDHESAYDSDLEEEEFYAHHHNGENIVSTSTHPISEKYPYKGYKQRDELCDNDNECASGKCVAWLGKHAACMPF